MKKLWACRVVQHHNTNYRKKQLHNITIQTTERNSCTTSQYKLQRETAAQHHNTNYRKKQLHNITIQTIERNNHDNQYNEEAYAYIQHKQKKQKQKEKKKNSFSHPSFFVYNIQFPFCVFLRVCVCVCMHACVCACMQLNTIYNSLSHPSFFVYSIQFPQRQTDRQVDITERQCGRGEVQGSLTLCCVLCWAQAVVRNTGPCAVHDVVVGAGTEQHLHILTPVFIQLTRHARQALVRDLDAVSTTKAMFFLMTSSTNDKTSRAR